MPEVSGVLTDSAERSPDVTVCIANWNCRGLLRECLASLTRNAQHVRLEIVVVDNASQDGAADMVAAAFPGVMLVRNRLNAGFARASNQAARLARGRYLFFLNNDTSVPAGTLRRLVDYAEAHPEAGLIGPRLCDAGGRTQVSCRPKPTVATLLHRTCLLRWTGLLKGAYRRYRRGGVHGAGGGRRVETLMGAAVLLPRNVFFGCGGWDEDFTFGGEDFDLSARVGRQHDVVYLADVVIRHHGRASTRANVAYSAPNVAIGFARFLRKSGSSRLGVGVYKLLISLDAPLLLFLKGAQCLWRRLTGRPAKAERSRQRVREAWYFLTRGLGEFWRV